MKQAKKTSIQYTNDALLLSRLVWMVYMDVAYEIELLVNGAKNGSMQNIITSKYQNWYEAAYIFFRLDL